MVVSKLLTCTLWVRGVSGRDTRRRQDAPQSSGPDGSETTPHYCFYFLSLLRLFSFFLRLFEFAFASVATRVVSSISACWRVSNVASSESELYESELSASTSESESITISLFLRFFETSRLGRRRPNRSCQDEPEVKASSNDRTE